MMCSCCKHSRYLLYRDLLPNEDGFLRVECAKIIKDSLWCVAYNKIVDTCKDEFCERSNSMFND